MSTVKDGVCFEDIFSKLTRKLFILVLLNYFQLGTVVVSSLGERQ